MRLDKLKLKYHAASSDPDNHYFVATADIYDDTLTYQFLISQSTCEKIEALLIADMKEILAK